MKGHVDKSRGIVILIDEALAKIKTTEYLRLGKYGTCRNRKRSDSSDSSPVKTPDSRWECKKNKRTTSSYHRIRLIRVQFAVMEDLLLGRVFKRHLRRLFFLKKRGKTRNLNRWVYDDFRLIFFHPLREASILAGELSEESDQFRFWCTVRLENLKGSVGLILTKTSSILCDLSLTSLPLVDHLLVLHLL